MNQEPSSELLVEQQGDTWILTLNRPEKRNALSASLIEALLGQIDAVAKNGARLLVFQGNGLNFSAGFDFTDYEAQSEGDLVLRFIRIEQLLQKIYHAPFETLALAHGKNFGAGVDIVCACNQRIGDPSATFRMPGLLFGLVLGTRRYLSRVSYGRQILQEAKTFDAPAAAASGFLTALAAKEDWPLSIEQAYRVATYLSRDALAHWKQVSTVDTRVEDLADLVTSAAAPGLKERIRNFRETPFP